jgi:hypothetical protein
MNVTWTELQYGAFDPTSDDYGNTEWLTEYYTFAGGAGYPSYSLEYSQRYLDIQALYVIHPFKKLTLSLGGGGLVGMYLNYIKINGLPVYIGPFAADGTPLYTPTTSPPVGTWESYWIEKNVVVEGGNALLYGLLASFKIEYFLSPRVSLNMKLNYKKVFGTLAYRYTLGGVSAAEDDPFLELSGWIPGLTPYGDDLDISFHSLGLYLGISGSF